MVDACMTMYAPLIESMYAAIPLRNLKSNLQDNDSLTAYILLDHF